MYKFFDLALYIQDLFLKNQRSIKVIQLRLFNVALFIMV